MRAPDGTVCPMSGVYEEILAPERLVFSSSALDNTGTPLFEVRHTVTLSTETGRTRPTLNAQVTRMTPAAAPYLQGHKDDWTQSLERLAGYAPAARSTVHATFVIERRLQFSPNAVFAAWADPAAKARWFAGPTEWKLLEKRADFRIGGREQLQGAWPNGVVSTFDARYRDIVTNERIVYVYDMQLDTAHISVSLATVEFKAEGAGTRLTVTKQGAFLDDFDDVGSRERGTGALLDKLAQSLRV